MNGGPGAPERDLHAEGKGCPLKAKFTPRGNRAQVFRIEGPDADAVRGRLETVLRASGRE